MIIKQNMGLLINISVNTLRSRHFADDIFKSIFLNKIDVCHYAFHWNSFPTLRQCCFRWWLGTKQTTCPYELNCDDNTVSVANLSRSRHTLNIFSYWECFQYVIFLDHCFDRCFSILHNDFSTYNGPPNINHFLCQVISCAAIISVRKFQ